MVQNDIFSFITLIKEKVNSEGFDQKYRMEEATYLTTWASETIMNAQMPQQKRKIDRLFKKVSESRSAANGV